MGRLTAFIWDLDGTLLDSYGSIVSSLALVGAEIGVCDSAEQIMVAVKRGSVSSYLREMAERSGVSYESLYRRYRVISHEKMSEITLIDGAAETLSALKNAGARHFVYTHRGASAGPLLSRLGLTDFFEEIVTFEYGFEPKPSGEGVRYLVQKYGLSLETTAYVGDRALDVGCAKDAGVYAILLLPANSCVIPTGEEDLVIQHLCELIKG